MFKPVSVLTHHVVSVSLFFSVFLQYFDAVGWVV